MPQGAPPNASLRGLPPLDDLLAQLLSCFSLSLSLSQSRISHRIPETNSARCPLCPLPRRLRTNEPTLSPQQRRPCHCCPDAAAPSSCFTSAPATAQMRAAGRPHGLRRPASRPLRPPLAPAAPSASMAWPFLPRACPTRCFAMTSPSNPPPGRTRGARSGSVCSRCATSPSHICP